MKRRNSNFEPRNPPRPVFEYGPAVNRGTTLLEVLIALLVLMAGFLAVAALQAMSLSNNHTALLRSQAVIQAHDMSDRMYANRTGVQDGDYSSISGIPASPPTCLTTAGPNTGALEAVDCTTAELAEFDAWEWNTQNAAVLPSGTGTVTGPDGNGAYTITVNWVEQRAGGTSNQSFSFLVEPLP